MIDFYIAYYDYPEQISTDFEVLRKLNPKACIYKSTLSEEVTDLVDDVTPYDGVFYKAYGYYDPETNTYMTSEDVDDIYASKVYSIGEEDAEEWQYSLPYAYEEIEYVRGNKVRSELSHG